MLCVLMEKREHADHWWGIPGPRRGGREKVGGRWVFGKQARVQAARRVEGRERSPSKKGKGGRQRQETHHGG